MDSMYFLNEEYTEHTEMPVYTKEELDYKSITEYRIGAVDFSLLVTMWFLALITSVRSFGRGLGILFLAINLLLVIRKASNGILVLLLLFYAPVLTLYIPRPFVFCSFIALLGYCVHSCFTRISSFFNKFFVSIGVFLFFSGMLIFISPNYSTAINYYMRYFEGFLAIILVFGLINSRESLGRMLKWWVIVASLSLVISTIHYVIGDNSVLFDYMDAALKAAGPEGVQTFAYVDGWKYNRLLWPGSEANYFAAYLIIAFGISIAFYSASLHKKYFWGICSLLIVIGVIGTFSRSGFLSTVFVLGLFLIRKNIRAIIPAGIIVGLGFMTLQFLPGIQERILGIHFVVEQGASGRFDLWKQAISMFFKSPIWGNGLGSYFSVYGKVTHNTYVQLLAETGVIGAVLYCFVIFLALRNCYNVKKYYYNIKHPDVQFFQIMIIAILGLCLMIATITFQDVKLLWMVCGACYLFCQLTKKELGY
ncbi:O-antigen ligase family protein [Planctomycetota bacterium]